MKAKSFPVPNLDGLHLSPLAWPKTLFSAQSSLTPGLFAAIHHLLAMP